jgi:hypothetical protein
MLDTDIYIRIPEDSKTFVYTIRRAGDLIETGAIHPFIDDEDEFVAPGYFYGGSQAMD